MSPPAGIVSIGIVGLPAESKPTVSYLGLLIDLAVGIGAVGLPAGSEPNASSPGALKSAETKKTYPYFKRFFASVQVDRVASATQADDDNEPPGLIVDDNSSDDSEAAPNRVSEASAGQYLRSGGFGKAANQVDINSSYLHGSATKPRPRGGRRGSGAIKNRSGSMSKSDPKGVQLTITAEGEANADADPRAQTRGAQPVQGVHGGRGGSSSNARSNVHSGDGPVINAPSNTHSAGGPIVAALPSGGRLAQDPFPGEAIWAKISPQDARDGRKGPGVQFLEDIKTSGFRR